MHQSRFSGTRRTHNSQKLPSSTFKLTPRRTLVITPLLLYSFVIFLSSISIIIFNQNNNFIPSNRPVVTSVNPPSPSIPVAISISLYVLVLVFVTRRIVFLPVLSLIIAREGIVKTLFFLPLI